MKLLPELEYISVAEAKARFSEKIHNTGSHGRRFAITSHGKPKAVLINYKDYIALVQQKMPSNPRVISAEDWFRNGSTRNELIHSVSSRFDTSQLSRKGQKEYKKNAVTRNKQIKK